MAKLSPFTVLSAKIEETFNKLVADKVLLFKVTNTKGMSHTYLNSFSEGSQYDSSNELYFRGNVDSEANPNVYENRLIYVSPKNPIHTERSHYDCNCCLNFIERAGSIVYFDTKLNLWRSLWSTANITGLYNNTVEDLHKRLMIDMDDGIELFRFANKHLGAKSNTTVLEGKAIEYNHFHVEVPVMYRDGKLKEQCVSAYQSIQSLLKLSEASIDAVIKLAQDNMITRAEQALPKLLLAKEIYSSSTSSTTSIQEHIAVAFNKGSLGQLNFGSVIFSLVKDIKKGMDLDTATTRYEKRVDPTAFNQSTTAPTKFQAQKAIDTINELGLRESLERRHAVISDISVNDVVWMDRVAQGQTKDSILGLIHTKAPKAVKIKGTIHIDIDDFMDLLPTATSLEVLSSTKLKKNIVTLIAPQHEDSKPITSWGNNFTLAYTGNYTDSVSQRVMDNKGSLAGNLRCSVAWDSDDDYDAVCTRTGLDRVYFGSKGRNSIDNSPILDIDANCSSIMSEPVENIIFKDSLGTRTYTFSVNNYSLRSRTPTDESCKVVIAYGDKLIHLQYPKRLRQHQDINIANIKTVNGKVVDCNINPQWSVTDSTVALNEEFVPVDTIMLSPNHWKSGSGIGSKHYLFISKEIKYEGQPRGFFSEFLPTELHQHRKVLTQVALNSLCEESKDQLTGFGFSTNKREQDKEPVTVRLTTDTTKRTYTINF